MVVLGHFGILSGNLELILPDVLAGVLADLEVLFGSPRFSLVNGVLSRTGVCVIRVRKSRSNGERFCFISLKSVFVVILTCFRELSSSLLLVNPDVFAGVLADFEILFRSFCNSLICLVITRTGIIVIFCCKRRSNGKSLTFVLFESVLVVILSNFRILSGNLELILPDVLAGVLADLEVLF